MTYLPSWNGRHKIIDSTTSLAPSLHLFTEASQTGFGIFYNGKWISEPWSAPLSSRSTQWKDLYPIYLACLIWGDSVSEKCLLFHCHNKAIVDIWETGTFHCPRIMSLIHKVFYLAATLQFDINIQHIRGVDNSIADHLSRFQLEEFRRLVPKGDTLPTQPPPNAWDI